jgi:UDPglucose 6-dehydrogenase
VALPCQSPPPHFAIGPDFNTLKAKLKNPVIFDGRNLYDPALVRGMVFEYLAIGR